MKVQTSFNPLQARYKLDPICGIKVQCKRFQSLIGTLQTEVAEKIGFLLSKVSIPYRHATNQRSYQIGMPPTKVSIPYRHATNQIEMLRKLEEDLVSIPYRHATNLNPPPMRFSALICFNPLQARYKHGTIKEIDTQKEGFNPLQARYKPYLVSSLVVCLIPVSIPYRHATNKE